MTPWLIEPFGVRFTSLLDGFLTILGNVVQVAQEASCCIKFALTTFRLLIYGDVLHVELVILR